MNLKTSFRQADAAVRLIYVNVGAFVLYYVASLLFKLLAIPFPLVEYVGLPALWSVMGRRLWTLLSYMFLHVGFLHLLFNMLCLFWFGKIVLTYLNGKQLTGLYLYSGLLAGLFYAVCYNLFPYFRPLADSSVLLGASGAIMGIVVAAALLAPRMEVGLMFVGRVQLKWIAVAMIAISVLGISGGNAGGELAHVGGALAGWLYITLYNKGYDPSRPFTRAIDRVVNLFRRTPKSRPQPQGKYHYSRPESYSTMTDAEYNQQKAAHSREVDEILDKIKRSGYASLTDEEKRTLFKQ